jgi:predicted esterase
MQVVKPYLPETAIDSWPQAAVAATDFALQYGLKDDLAPPKLSVDLEGQLKQQGLDLKVGPPRQCAQLSALYTGCATV